MIPTPQHAMKVVSCTNSSSNIQPNLSCLHLNPWESTAHAKTVIGLQTYNNLAVLLSSCSPTVHPSQLNKTATTVTLEHAARTLGTTHILLDALRHSTPQGRKPPP